MGCSGEVEWLGGSGGGLQGDLVAEGFEFADVVAFLTFWVDPGVVVAGAEVVELDGVVLQEVPDDDQDGATYRNDSLLLAAAAGDATVAFAQERVNSTRADGGLAPGPGPLGSGRRVRWSRCPSCGPRTP